MDMYDNNTGRVERSDDDDVLYRKIVYVTAEDGTL